MAITMAHAMTIAMTHAEVIFNRFLNITPFYCFSSNWRPGNSIGGSFVLNWAFNPSDLDGSFGIAWPGQDGGSFLCIDLDLFFQ